MGRFSIPNVLSLMDAPSLSWELQINKYIRLILEEDKNKPYVIGISSSSITAGHDNFFDEAYPVMAPVVHEIGVKFEVRNHALGNNPCYPYDACVSTHMVRAKLIITYRVNLPPKYDSAIQFHF